MNEALPQQLTEQVSVYGSDHFRHYLVGKDPAVLIECGVTASATDLPAQLFKTGRQVPAKLLAMHAHFDHVCGIPTLKQRFPDAEVLASPVAGRVLSKPVVVTGFFEQDRKMGERLAEKAGKAPELLQDPPDRICVDRTVKGGDRILLQGGEALELIDAPGHSPCGLAAWLEKDRVLFVSDSLGFQISDTEIFPIFFHSYREYIETIQRLSAYPARILAFAHERIWKGSKVNDVFARSLAAARDVRGEILSEIEKGKAEAELKQLLFNRFYHGNLRIYTPENIRICVDLLVRRSVEDEV